MDNAAVEPELTLAEALVQWCDPVLVEAVRREERSFIGGDLEELGRPVLTSAAERRAPSPDTWMALGAQYTKLNRAWDALERDLRRRVVRDLIFLAGVPTVRVRGARREPIPGVWMADAAMHLLDDVVVMPDERFIAVVAARTMFPGKGEAAAEAASEVVQTPPDLDDSTVMAATIADTPIVPALEPRRRGGRQNYGKIIETALRDRWTKMPNTKPAPGDPLPEWSGLAGILYKQIWGPRPGNRKGEKLPQQTTIQKRLPNIYERLMDETVPD